MTTQHTDGLSLRGYVEVMARWKWLILVVTLLVTLIGAAYTWTRTPMYSSSAKLLYVKQVDFQNPLGQSYIDASSQQAVLESVPTIIAGARVRQNAEKLMSEEELAAGYSVSASLTAGANNYYSSVVGIEGVSADPETAAAAANAYAQSFMEWRRESAKSQVADAIEVVKSRMETFTSAEAQDSSDYRALAQRLQDLELLEASINGGFEVIATAGVPSEPFSPDKFRSLLIALVVGAVLGVGLAFLLEQFDTRVHGDEQIAQMLGLPILGHVPLLPRKGKRVDVLPTLTDSSGVNAEAFRLLRSNLDFMGIDGDISSLMITSSIQGEGKSVTICNLAVSMALAGKRVVLVDADLRSPRVHAYFGTPNVLGVSQVVARRVDLSKAVIPVVLDPSRTRGGSVLMGASVRASGSNGKNAKQLHTVTGQPAAAPGLDEWVWPDETGEAPILRLLTSGLVPPNPGEIVASRRFGEIINELSASADLVLIDAPAMLAVGDTAALAPKVEALAFVVNPEQVRRPMLQRAHEQFAKLPCRKLGFIVIGEAPVGGYYGYYSAGRDAPVAQAPKPLSSVSRRDS